MEGLHADSTDNLTAKLIFLITVGWSERFPRHGSPNNSSVHHEWYTNRGSADVHSWIPLCHCHFQLWNLLFRGKNCILTLFHC